MIKSLHDYFQDFGINIHKLLVSFFSLPSFFLDYIKLRFQYRAFGMKTHFSIKPCFYEKYQNAGTTRGHYFHQDLYVASRIFVDNPYKHVDVGSRIDGFVAHVACYRAIEVFDIRPSFEKLHSINFKQLDFMEPVNKEYFNYCDSISCLHALEHFGLGRYGDPVDAIGYKKGLKNLCLMLSTGGILYLSVPIGREQVCFNAHRIFNPLSLLNELDHGMELQRFSYVDDSGDFFENINLSDFQTEILPNLKYGCGIFEILKKKI